MTRYTASTVAEVVAAYERGQRTFDRLRIDHADFRGRDLHDIDLVEVSLRGANFDKATLYGASLVAADLTGASLNNAYLDSAHFSQVEMAFARLTNADLEDAVLHRVDLGGADLTGCWLHGASLVDARLEGATVDGAGLGHTAFSDVDVSPFCEAALVHSGPSYVDLRSVLRACHHPGLKGFLVDCGVPPLVAEFTISAAQAEGDTLATLMRSTFISYGGPDETFARRLYEELRAHGVTTFFFPENARLGRRIGDEVHSRIQEHDRVILVCSRDSLDRPGVRNEIQETFDREARDGGATYLLPIRLDDYVLTGWQDPLAGRVRDRVVGDFSGAMEDSAAFDRAMSRLLAALRREQG